MIDQEHGWTVSFKPLAIGFVFSILLLTSSFFLLTRHHLKNPELDMVLWGFSTLQAVIQLIFFFHVGLRNKPRWHMITLFFTLLVILIVIAGTLWITSNLNYNMMPEMNMQETKMPEMKMQEY